MAYPKTPELDKLSEMMELHEVTQRLGEALDSEDGFVLAAWVPDLCMNCGGGGEEYDIWKNTHSTCERCKGSGSDPTAITLAHRSPSNRNLAILFGLDHEKMEAERDAVLKHVQAEAREA
ncbi:hypothetical protein LCGC14_1999170 [marine sediment metagenome]|uniref:Uncharacterized protein n=1 Tax=marine sediment metagenome TaxID=412755 RepID=A0A0F9HH61_9ZZZZ